MRLCWSGAHDPRRDARQRGHSRAGGRRKDCYPAPVLDVPRTPHAIDASELSRELDVDLAVGLSQVEAERRLARVGPNALPQEKRRPLAWVLLGQFKSPLIYLLLGAALIALALGERADAAVIAVVVVVNAVIGAVQEGRAERSLEALRKLSGVAARARRDGKETALPAIELVPGDVITLSAGDAVPADARVIEAARAETDEAALTGESLPVEKTTPALPPESRLPDRTNMIFAGTNLVSGRARALVTSTGSSTEVGHIAKLTGGAVEPKTPLETRIERFGRTLLFAAAAIFVLVSAIGVWRGVAAGEIAMIAISQVVGMVPEGLPVAMTIALAVGVQRMAKRRAIVRRLAAVETLGSITVICSDKTGTLTKNEMTATRLVLPGGDAIDVAGVGYEPRGKLTRGGEVITAAPGSDLFALLEVAVLCNDAELVESEGGVHRVLGDPTEGALVVLARKAGLDPAALRQAAPRTGEIPFSSADKRMATEHERAGTPYLAVKGGPEAVLPFVTHLREGGLDAPIGPERRAQLAHAVDDMTGRGLRVLAFALAPDQRASEGIGRARTKLVLLGLIGELDPPREGAKSAVARCRTAGIRPIMITGDHKRTALAIGRELGLVSSESDALDGAELARLSDAELRAAVSRVSVFSRVEPADKLRIVTALQANGDVAAMTGDGVNDAPAIARADVGVAMGTTGTDVAKQASKVVVLDDDFATIVAAIEEGRVVYANLRKVLLLLLSTSLAEVAVLTLAMVLGFPPPFVAVQILWNNLVTEGVVTVNLVLEPAEGNELERPPSPRDEPLVTRAMAQRIGLMTLAIVVSTLGWYVFRIRAGVPQMQASTEAFTVLAVCEWFNVLSCRSATQSALSFGLVKNPYLLGGLVAGNLLQVAVIFWPPMNALFHTVPMDLSQVVMIGAVASLVFWVEELRKWLWRTREATRAVEASR